MGKVIDFPKEKMKTPPQSKKELDAELLNNKVAYVDDVASYCGIDVTKEYLTEEQEQQLEEEIEEDNLL